MVLLIPGPNEPQLEINSFLSPLVDELLEFLHGIQLKVYSFPTPRIIKCVACDMPAARKVSGFLGHSSKLASSFSGFTAHQFKKWTNIYTLFALRDILSPADYECWRHLVLASRLLNQIRLSLSDIAFL